MAENFSAIRAAACILVVEDDPALRSLVCEAFRATRHQVLEASGALQAREVLSQNDVDLVLCDLHLEDSESGVVLLRELAPRSPDLAVLMMTGNATIEIAIDCLRAGAFDYLLKPFTIDELQAVTRR